MEAAEEIGGCIEDSEGNLPPLGCCPFKSDIAKKSKAVSPAFQKALRGKESIYLWNLEREPELYTPAEARMILEKQARLDAAAEEEKAQEEVILSEELLALADDIAKTLAEKFPKKEDPVTKVISWIRKMCK
jgi:hypothetical protein